jgi:hypothetical protein
MSLSMLSSGDWIPDIANVMLWDSMENVDF